MMRWFGWRLIALLAFCCVVSSHVSAAERRVALVVGNNAYASVPRLANPANDAKLMATTLKSAGFTLIGGGAQTDLSKTGFDAAVSAFGHAIQGADVALFYYSGHGMQVGGTNYLVPIDANPGSTQDLDFQMVSADVVLRQFSGGGAKLNLLILDACRNNPFGGRGLRGAAGGLAEMHAPEGTLISYATQPGNVASDGAGRDSPYTTALAEAIQTPGLDLLRLFNHVGLAVKKSTGGEQQPWLASSPLEGDFYFRPPATQAATAEPATVPESPEAASQPKQTAMAHSSPPSHETPSHEPPPHGPPPHEPPSHTSTPSAPPTAPPADAAVALAPQAGGGFHCPRAGLTSVTNGEHRVWNGSAPDTPNLCLSTIAGKQSARLFGWHDMWHPSLLAAEAPMQQFFAGATNDASYTVANYVFAWTRVGQDVLNIGGQKIQVQKLDQTVTQTHDIWIGNKTIHKVQHSGVWHLWFDPQTGLYLKGQYDALQGDRSFETEDWEVTAISG